MKYNPVKQTKALRVELDSLLQELKADRLESDVVEFSSVQNRKSRERSLAITKIQEAIMWLGMDLKAMNEAGIANLEDPYPDSYNPLNDRVAETADGIKL
jgi:hypothetical protein